MKRLIFALLCATMAISLFLLLHPESLAQTPTVGMQTQLRRQIYLFTAGGNFSGVRVGPSIPVPPYRAWHIGGGAEKFLIRGMAVGVELAKTPRQIRSQPVTYSYRSFSGEQQTTTVRSRGARGWLSFNLSYHLKDIYPNQRFVPFVTAGASILVHNDPTESVNYGGGFTYWATRHFGTRVEYRKFRVDEGEFETRLRSVRVGITLR